MNLFYLRIKLIFLFACKQLFAKYKKCCPSYFSYTADFYKRYVDIKGLHDDYIVVLTDMLHIQNRKVY